MRAKLFDDEAVQQWMRTFVAKYVDEAADRELSVAYPAAGNKTPLAIVTTSAGRRFVVRLVNSVSGHVKLVSIQRQLMAWDLPVPAVVGVSVRSIIGPPRHAAILETAVPGAPWLDGNKEQRGAALAPIAATLARFHAIPRASCRSWVLSGRRRAARPVLARARERLGRLRTLIGDETTSTIRAGLARAGESARTVAADVLIHGRVNNNNFLIEDGRVHVVDLDAVTFGHAAQDLVRAVHRLGRAGPHHREIFCNAYREHAQIDEQALARTWPLYEADMFLSRAVGHAREHEKSALTTEERDASIASELERVRAALAGERSPLTAD